jgi:dolichyl-phosphate-mannose--protein O-mannosyl transferase
MGLLTTAGITFGLATAVKWNGLWFLLGVYGLIAIARVICWWPYRSSPPDAPINPLRPTQTPRWLRQLSRLSLWQIALYLAVVPFVFYALSWLPHLLLCQTDPQGLCRPYLSRSANVDLSPPSLPGLFFELNTQILSYHQRVGGNAPSVHPYCSAWFTWLFMLRPIAYFYQVTPKDAPLPAGQWKLPPSEDTVIYDVHSMGNPLLWWLSLGAIGLLLLSLGEQLVAHLKQRAMNSPSARQALPPDPAAESDLQPAASIPWGVPLFLLVNYVANLLPWVRVTRCTFLYHYLSASVFAWMALAWFCDRWLVSREPAARWLSLAIILGIGLAFLFWLPIYLGLPLSPLEFQWRMWFRSWV